MQLHQLFLTKNACYMAGVPMTPRGIMIHSTGADNPNLRRYVQPDDGLLGTHPYNNHWNNYHPGGKEMGPHTFVNDGTGYCAVCGGRQVCAHAMIGKLADGDIATYQLLPWDWQSWHSGSGTRGQANRLGYIGFEICEDSLTDPEYFLRTYNEAVGFCAYICDMFGLDPMGTTPEGYPVILDHVTGCELGIAAPHGDVGHWWPMFGKYLDDFRADVAEKMGGESMSYEQWKKYMEQYKSELAQAEASDWAKQEGVLERAKASGVSDGTRPRSDITREECMAMVLRATGK